jgi:hypothetical protein
MPRRWLQFSLRFLLAAMLASACAAWWFRPGIVKPEFSLDRLVPGINDINRNEVVFAHVRLRNVGPDSIWLDPSAFLWNTDEKEIVEIDEQGRETIRIGVGGLRGSSHSQRIRLKPGESSVFVVPLGAATRAVTVGVVISDRRNRRARQALSQSFTIDETMFPHSP